MPWAASRSAGVATGAARRRDPRSTSAVSRPDGASGGSVPSGRAGAVRSRPGTPRRGSPARRGQRAGRDEERGLGPIGRVVMLGGQGRVQGLGAVGVAELIRVRAQFGRPGQQGRKDVEFIRVGRARQDADAPQARGAEGASFGQAEFGSARRRTSCAARGGDGGSPARYAVRRSRRRAGRWARPRPASRTARASARSARARTSRARGPAQAGLPGTPAGPGMGPRPAGSGHRGRLPPVVGLGHRREQQRPTRRCQ